MCDRFSLKCKSTTLKGYRKNFFNGAIRTTIKSSKQRFNAKLNQKKYYETFRQLGYQKSTEDLCSEVKDIGEMDILPVKHSSNLTPEAIEWHKQDQIAYWKSRAVSLELENRMLKDHLRNVYAHMIKDQSGNYQNHREHIKYTEKCNSDEKELQNEVIPNVPNPELKNRLKEMRNIFGENAEKIMGMETAIQLNYERHLEQDQPFLWPSIPLKLVFEN